MEIDRYSEIPPWQQVAAEVRRMIVSGEIPPHRPIPSKRAAVQEWGIAGATYDKAVKFLKDRHLVASVSGMGVYVLDPASWDDAQAG
jgi:GntR family transcriptional regulator